MALTFRGGAIQVTPHLEAKQGDYAETVLLPGDPLRAKWIAETFFEAPRLVNDVRNCFGYTGRYKGKPVSVQATGMGQPSLAIYVNELISVYGAKVLIRVGTCGGLTAKLKARDLVLAMTACTDSSMNRAVFGAYDFAPPADFGLLRDAAALADARGLRCHVGNMLSSDVFYHKDWRAAYGVLVDHGVLAVEMETSTLYTLAARFGVRALSVCAISDNLVTGEVISPDDRQSSLTDLARLVLDVAAGDSGKG
jgi:purine-nucleoside phosphorylase